MSKLLPVQVLIDTASSDETPKNVWNLTPPTSPMGCKPEKIEKINKYSNNILKSKKNNEIESNIVSELILMMMFLELSI